MLLTFCSKKSSTCIIQTERRGNFSDRKENTLILVNLLSIIDHIVFCDYFHSHTESYFISLSQMEEDVGCTRKIREQIYRQPNQVSSNMYAILSYISFYISRSNMFHFQEMNYSTVLQKSNHAKIEIRF